MKSPFPRRRRQRILLSIILGSFFSALLFSFSLTAQDSNLPRVFTPQPLTDDSDESYDPAHYGLPETIAGLRVLAVRNSGNTACMLHPELILQPVDEATFSYSATLAPDKIGQIEMTLEEIASEWSAGVAIVGLQVTREQIIAHNREWNAIMKSSGCFQSGPAIIGTSARSDAPAKLPTP